MNRRDMLIRTTSAAAALGLMGFPLGWADDKDAPKRKLLFFTRSAGFEHSVVKRKTANELSYAEKLMTEWSAKHNFDVTCTKDGSIFTAEKLAPFDAFMFYTTGDLTGGDPVKPGKDFSLPMSKEGKQAFLDAVKGGKGFIGSHCGSDTFHSKSSAGQPDTLDPYIAMLGGEFITHGSQQDSKMTCVDAEFPGMADAKDGFKMNEEWYALKNHAKDLHVLLVQETTGMKGNMYMRPPYPATWAREHDKGRVFFTSMGHREDVWSNPIFQSVLLGGLSWAFGNVKANVAPNIDKVTPEYATLSKPEAPKAPAK